MPKPIPFFQLAVFLVSWASAEDNSIFDYLKTLGFSETYQSQGDRHIYQRKGIRLVIQECNPVFTINGHYYHFDYFPYISRPGPSLKEKDFRKFQKRVEKYYRLFPPGDDSGKPPAPPVPKNIKKDISPRSKTREKSDRSAPLNQINYIFLDAGHGGEDPGAQAYGFKEKDIAFSITRELAAKLKKMLSKKVKIIMTREKDQTTSLEARCHLANRHLGSKKNGIFISIHLNYWFDPKTYGFEVYYLSHQPNSFQARVRSTIKRENFDITKTNLEGHSPVDIIISSLEVVQYQKESRLIAHYLSQSLEQSRKYPSINRGVKSELFYVLKGALMPSVLVEVGFISNKSDLDYLTHKNKRKRLISNLAKGVRKFLREFNESNGFQSKFFYDDFDLSEEIKE